ncbi:MAG: hypothetical protein V7K97_30340 [Nostoc sp.]|uniref:hypothetical protein n=1 Tax=Nostoc sp. TaxID=1180 RepID=UPI002FFA884A
MTKELRQKLVVCQIHFDGWREAINRRLYRKFIRQLVLDILLESRFQLYLDPCVENLKTTDQCPMPHTQCPMTNFESYRALALQVTSHAVNQTSDRHQARSALKSLTIAESY